MSNPAHSIATALAEHIPAHWAAIGGVIGMGAAMILVILAFLATAHWMERRNRA